MSNFKDGKLLSVLAIIWLLSAFYSLGSIPLLDNDEPIYGQFVKEMVESGDWVTPHYQGRIWYDKPPLYYWLASCCSKIFGINEFSFRLPSVLASILLVLIVIFWAYKKNNLSIGIYAGIIQATCLQHIILARSAVTDMLLALFLTLALVAFDLSVVGNHKYKKIIALIGGISIGLAILTKGPVALFLLGLTFIIYLALNKKLSLLLCTESIIAITLSLALALPWFIYSYHIHPKMFYHDMIWVNHIQRFSQAEHPEQTGQWYAYLLNIPILFAFFFPWSVFLVQSLKNIVKKNKSKSLQFIWFCVVFGFFSLAKTKLVTYIFPLYPVASIFVAKFIYNSIENTNAQNNDFKNGLKAMVVISILIFLTLVVTAYKKFPDALFVSSTTSLCLIFTTIFAYKIYSKNNKQYKRGNVLQSFYSIAFGLLIFSILLFGFSLKHVSHSYTRKTILSHLPKWYKKPLLNFRIGEPSLIYYSSNMVVKFKSVASLTNYITTHSKMIIVTKNNDLHLLATISSPLYTGQQCSLLESINNLR